MPKTADASVDETIAPTKHASCHGRPIQYVNQAVIVAIPTTPMVARTDAGATTVLTQWTGVCRPPANNTADSASVPTAYASGNSSNSMLPGPSQPASMPMTRKINETGTPSRTPKRLSKQLSASNTPPAAMASAVRSGASSAATGYPSIDAIYTAASTSISQSIGAAGGFS